MRAVEILGPFVAGAVFVCITYAWAYAAAFAVFAPVQRMGTL